jgi:demethylmenaquinone methyltransferase/2-methoxy-6-polyprenyl-1,4-benzoquinol methylase
LEAPKNLVPKFFGDTAATYDSVAMWATFGKDKLWKKEIVRQIHGVNTILDLACGTGILTRKIAQRFPYAQVVGVDITQSYLDVARQNSKQYRNISFILQDAEQLSLDMKFDCITSSYIPKYCNPETLVKACMIHLKPEGKVILHDFVYPHSPLVRRMWNAYFVLLRFVGFFIPSWKAAFLDLPKLIRTSNWVDDYSRVMKENGFDVKVQFLTWSTSAVLTGIKRSYENSLNKEDQGC